jgi:hypothetical protein
MHRVVVPIVRRGDVNVHLRLAFAAIAVFATAICSVAGAADVPAQLTVTQLGPIQASLEHQGVTYDERDGGFSAPIGNHRSLWVFGDSLILHGAAPYKIDRWVTGSTAAIGVTESPGPPQELDEVQPGSLQLSPTTMPTHFLSFYSRIYLPGSKGQLCLNSKVHYPARWTTGIAKLADAPIVMISFVDACVFTLNNWDVEGFGVAEFDTATNRFSLTPTDVQAPASDGAKISWPYVSFYPVTQPNGELDIFSWRDNTLEFTRVEPTTPRLLSASTYAKLTGVSVQGGWPGHVESVGYYPTLFANAGGYLALSWSSTPGTIAVMASRVASGPWRIIGEAAMPGCVTAPNGCRSVQGHPDLSTGAALAVTYYVTGSVSTDTEHLELVDVALN